MANLQETSTWEAGIYQLETSDPVMGGENGIDNRAPRQLANRTLWLKNELAKQIDLVNQASTNLGNQKADKAVQFTAGNGLTGGGDLSTHRTLSLGTPSKITANSTNVAISNTHSHEIDKASDTVAGIVKLSHETNGTDRTKAASEYAVGEVRRLANQANVAVNGIALTWDNIQNKPAQFNPTSHTHPWSQITGVPSFAPSSHTHHWNNITNVPVASTATQGIVQLSHETNGTDRTKAASEYAVGEVRRLANQANVAVNGIALTWDNIQNKPAQFNPTSHTHPWSQITGVPSFAPSSHTHRMDDISGLANALGNKLDVSSNAVSASRLANARTISMTGDGTWQVEFDGTGSARGSMTLSGTGVSPGSYNLVTVDSKGRVTAGNTQRYYLTTGISETSTSGAFTGNTNTYLNIIANDIHGRDSVMSSLQITGSNGISIASNTSGRLLISQDIANSLTDSSIIKPLSASMGKKLQEDKLDKTGNAASASRLATARNIALTGAVTGNVNFDGSGNVSLTTTLTKAVVRDYNSSFNSSVGSSNYNIVISGQVVASPDGRITQYIHVQHFRDFWFPMNENSVGNYSGEGTRSRLLQIPLWTAMPNKILSVSAQAMRSTNTAQSAGFFGEAAEHQVAWAKRQQGINKTHAFVEMARIMGAASEEIDMFIVVEGY